MFVSLVFCGTPNSGSEGALDSFACSWYPFPPTGVLCPILILGFVPSFIVSFHAIFIWLISLGDLLISEGKQRRSGSGEEGS